MSRNDWGMSQFEQVSSKTMRNLNLVVFALVATKA